MDRTRRGHRNPSAAEREEHVRIDLHRTDSDGYVIELSGKECAEDTERTALSVRGDTAKQAAR